MYLELGFEGLVAYVNAIEQSGVREKLQTLIAGVAAADERTATRTSGPRA